jgi:hypothetical protein
MAKSCIWLGNYTHDRNTSQFSTRFVPLFFPCWFDSVTKLTRPTAWHFCSYRHDIVTKWMITTSENPGMAKFCIRLGNYTHDRNISQLSINKICSRGFSRFLKSQEQVNATSQQDWRSQQTDMSAVSASWHCDKVNDNDLFQICSQQLKTTAWEQICYNYNNWSSGRVSKCVVYCYIWAYFILFYSSRV